MVISQKDKNILRELVKKQVDLANTPAMGKISRDWEARGKLDTIMRPSVYIELGTFANDILPGLMRCEGAEAREMEWWLHGKVVNHTLFGDDTPVLDYLDVRTQRTFVPYDLPVQVERTTVDGQEGLGHHFISQISDLEEDYPKLKKSTWQIDLPATKKRIEELSELFGDIAPVKHDNACLVSCPTQDIVHIMSMEDMYIAMMTAPELFHEMMARLTDDYCAFFEDYERLGALTSTTGGQHLGNGTYCFTSDLPDKKENVRVKDVWGFMDSQETSAISPAMYGEFVLPYYKKVAAKFGLLSYGCCEPVHTIWNGMLDTIENLRKVSISPWCDESMMGEALKGKRIVYLRKPTPNLIGVGTGLDEEAVRTHFKDTLDATRGCHVEFSMRDIYRVGSAERVKRYIDIIKKTIDENWKG